jgi:hypothetical protein
MTLPLQQAAITLAETHEEGFSTESFSLSWHQAMTGQTLPLAQLWEDDISDEEQSEINAQFGAPEEQDGDAIDMTKWVKTGGQLP